ncbi:unnamed protein product [Nezara viridula]|uniref:Uncharacterized protein n=1 Tax=Nezara viridula TaxID=85310 RepID=A0A9P0MWD1_NEZVI|nr:unnamed protein product [Nezara viridula]
MRIRYKSAPATGEHLTLTRHKTAPPPRSFIGPINRGAQPTVARSDIIPSYLLHTSIFSGFSDKCLQVLISRLGELDTLDQKTSYRVSYKAVACTTYLTGFNSQSSIF